MARKRFLALVGSFVLCAVLINLIGCDLSFGGEMPSETGDASGSGDAERITAAAISSATEQKGEYVSEVDTAKTDDNMSGNVENPIEIVDGDRRVEIK